MTLYKNVYLWSQPKVKMKMQWLGFYDTCVHIYAKLGQENLLRMVR